MEKPRSNHVTRRDVLRIGGATGIGLSLPQLLQAQASTPRGSFGRAKQMIMLFLHGGHPQQETFDPKPNGPVDVRGEFGAIATDVAGTHVSELLPLTSKMMGDIAVIRSVSHDNPNHVQACLPAQTGHKHPPGIPGGDFPPSAKDFPPIGAVIDSLRPGESLPSWVRIGPLMRRSNGTVLHGQLAGFLGTGHDSFVVDQKLLKPDVEVQATRPAGDLTAIRLRDRFQLRSEFNRRVTQLNEAVAHVGLDEYYGKAVDLLTSNETREAFQLSKEKPTTRDRYGKTEFGQRCLLARRLAEAGVPVVNVSYCHTPAGSWDTHSRNADKMKKSLAPTLDQALTALISDLKERGRLDDTLVVVNAEFGRTPKINKNAGRDHWPWVYSLAFAGAGIAGGTVFGASDKSAAYPASQPVGPEDVAATLYHLLGVPSDSVLHDATNRPHRLIIGSPINGILT